MRLTRTNLDFAEEKRIEDYWLGQEVNDRELSGEWLGSTLYYFLRPRPPPGWYWSEGGRLTQRTKPSSKPDEVWVEEWRGSKSRKDKLRKYWDEERPRRDALRKDRKSVSYTHLTLPTTPYV